MGLDIQRKQKIISKINKVIENSISAVVAALEGITANEINYLRSMCRKKNVYVYVIRNTLMARAIENNRVFSHLRKIFFGSNIIAFSIIDASDCIKVFVQFSKENKRFKIKGAVFDGVFFEESKVSLLSSLPTYRDSIINLMFVIKESAIGRLIRLLYVLYKCEEYQK